MLGHQARYWSEVNSQPPVKQRQTVELKQAKTVEVDCAPMGMIRERRAVEIGVVTQEETKMTKKRFVSSAAAVSVLALASSFGVGRVLGVGAGQADTGVTKRSHASWVYKTTDPARMARDVDAIVLATWVGVSPGRVAHSSNGEDVLAFELNDFTVEEVVKGNGVGGALTIERVATDQGGRMAVFDHDGGHFVPGTRYLLFLQKQPNTSFFIQINDEGRYVIDGRSRLRSPGSGKVADALRGRSLEDVRTFLQRALRTP